MANAAAAPGTEVKLALPAPGRSGERVLVTITSDEFMSITDIVDPAILMFWRTFEAVGQQATEEDVWRHMADSGIRDEGHPTIRRETVQAAVARLAAAGLLSLASDGAE